ncbi:LacI family DNA-binding transcriptional regulator [Massilia aurea]|uniref:LacI family DNA-binding transcriptional regulator n=1 Tax=Massilia aurea TaxID=373040 RepID=UPI0034626C9F
MKDLAGIVGVTKVTISRALNTPDQVSPETLRRVQEAIRDTGYVPNLLAGALASNRSKLIVALIPSLSGSVFQETTEAMTIALAAAGYQFLIGQSGYDESREDALLDAVIGRRPAGIVLTGVVHSPASRKRLAGAGVPIVETWDLTEAPIDMLVGFSHAQVGAAAARHLHARGGRRAAVITPNDRRALARSAAFVDTMAALTGRAVPVYPAPSPTHLGHGREALARVLGKHPDTDSIFCGADSLALGVLMEAGARGITVPQQLKVLGYGDVNFAAHTTPALTTIRVNGSRIGELAASMLIQRIEKADVATRVVDVGFEFIERAST